MTERILDSYDGVTEYHSVDPVTGKTIIRTSQDVEPILDRNKKLRDSASSGWKGDMHHVASIPEVLWLQWIREFGGNPMSKENRPKLIKKLNDLEFSKLRTKEGRI